MTAAGMIMMIGTIVAVIGVVAAGSPVPSSRVPWQAWWRTP
jgi:hypothetical protein